MTGLGWAPVMRCTIAGGCLIGASIALSACTADPNDEKRERSSAILAELPADEPGCSVAVAIDGEVVWADARGIADLETMTELDTSTRFTIASISKQFTALAVLMLAESGALGLEDPISLHLDGMPDWADEVRVSDLMHHTSDITDYFLLIDLLEQPPPITDEVVLDAVRTDDAARLGSKGAFEYSNTNYALLADIVESVTGEDFREWMTANVFEPTGLEMTIAPMLPDDAATGYVDEGTGFAPQPRDEWDVHGGTGIVTTPSELARWGQQLHAPTLISQESLDAAYSDAVAVDDAAYGPGLFLMPDGTLTHGGFDLAQASHFVVSADGRTTFAGSCNQDGLDGGTLVDGLWEVWTGETESRG